MNQNLHVAMLEGDHDALVLEVPHATHGYTDEHDSPDSHAVQRPRNRVRPGKQAVWRRRTNMRRQRAEAYLSRS